MLWQSGCSQELLWWVGSDCWFWILAMTTIGYGDLIPRGVLSKRFLCVFDFTGMTIVGLLLSIVVEYFACWNSWMNYLVRARQGYILLICSPFHVLPAQMHWSPHRFAITGNQQEDVLFLKTIGIPKRYACGCFLLQDYMNSKAFSRFGWPVFGWNFTPIHCKCIAPWVHLLFVVFFTLLGLCNIQYLNSNFKPPNPNWHKW